MISLILLIVVVFVAMLMPALMISGLGRGGAGRPGLAAAIRRYGPRREAAPEPGDNAVTSAAVGSVGRLLRWRATDERLRQRLEAAGISRGPAEWALLGCCAGIVVIAVLTLLTGSIFLAVPIGGLAVWLGMRLVLSQRITRRRAAFAEQLPNVLQLIAGSLQSGFSLAQALDTVVREEPQPISGEFARALSEARLGGDLAVALDRVADRMGSEDLHWAVMTVRIVRQVGGNLSEVLRNTVGTIRERAYLGRHVRALSAEGRLSAYILGALPLLIAVWMFCVSRSYMRPLYSSPFGLVMLAGAATLFVAGAFWMRKLIKVVV